jgi:hypothetical protein
MTAQEAYDLALAKAQAWQSDAVFISMQTTTLGPVDAEGKSESWTLHFYSPSTDEINLMLFISGVLNTSPSPNQGSPTPLPALDSVSLDTKSIYDIAAAAGGSEYLAQGAKAGLALTPYPLDKDMPTWYVSYAGADERKIFLVVIDARTGEVVTTTQ